MARAAVSEDDLLAWLRRRLRNRTAERGRELIGDDAALLPDGTAVTTDTQIEGLHFLPDLDPAIVAQRLLAVNLSDMAAVGAQPAYAFLVLAAPRSFDHRRFFAALLRAAKRYDVALAGGDLTRHPDLITALTLIGKKPRGGRWVRRSAARPGDGIWLGGTVGEAGSGRILLQRGARMNGRKVVLPEDFSGSTALRSAARAAVRRHLAPRPQLELGWWLARRRRAAAIDLSDGLARDLHRLCRESGTGAVIDRERLPTARRHHELADGLRTAGIDLALSGGEDYVLLFTLPRRVSPPASFECHRIGRITAVEGGILLADRDEHRVLPAAGWDHLAT